MQNGFVSGQSKLNTVIAVDLDGTLILADSLHESMLQLVRQKIISIFWMPIWLFKGKAEFKAKIAEIVNLNVALLPYNLPLIEWLKQQRALGKKVILTTAADQKIAQSIADHVGLFDEVLASNGTTNNATSNKRDLLNERFGVNGWDYAGNSSDDLIVWKAANCAIVVNANNATIKQANQLNNVAHVFPSSKVSFSQWLKVLRVHQWLKNLLLFVPLMAAHQLGNFDSIFTLIVAFIAFCFCASAVYIANDLLDLESDRLHIRKRQRSFATGLVSIRTGFILSILLASFSIAIAFVVGCVFAAWLMVYLTITCAYTLWLKKIVLVDCLTLSGLYTLRIIAGATAAAVVLSFWLLAFSVFIFLSLAFVKRYAELHMQADAGNFTAHGRGYMTTDAPLIQSLGIAAGYAAVIVFSLYLHSDSVLKLYSRPEIIWLAVPLMLFWVSWVWMKAHRGLMHDDPIVFAVKDKSSLAVAAMTLMCFMLASKVIAN